MGTPPTTTQLQAAVAALDPRLRASAAWFAALPLHTNPVQAASQYRGSRDPVAAAVAAAAPVMGEAVGDVPFPPLEYGPVGWLRALPSPTGCLLAGTHLLDLPPLLLSGVAPAQFDQDRDRFAPLAAEVGVAAAARQLWAVTPSPPGVVVSGVRPAVTPPGGLDALLAVFSRWGPCEVHASPETVVLEVRIGTHRVRFPVTMEGAAAQVGIPLWRWDRGAAPPAALLPLPEPLVWVGQDTTDGAPLGRLERGGPAGVLAVDVSRHGGPAGTSPP